MLIDILPVWACVLALAAILVGKTFLFKRLEKSALYAHEIEGKGWMATLLIVAGANALITAILIFVFAGFTWAVTFGIFDFAVHFLTGYYKIKKALPKVGEENLATAASWWSSISKWITAIHGVSYVSIATYVFEVVQKHPEWVAKILSIFHLG